MLSKTGMPTEMQLLMDMLWKRLIVHLSDDDFAILNTRVASCAEITATTKAAPIKIPIAPTRDGSRCSLE